LGNLQFSLSMGFLSSAHIKKGGVVVGKEIRGRNNPEKTKNQRAATGREKGGKFSVRRRTKGGSLTGKHESLSKKSKRPTSGQGKEKSIDIERQH